MILSLSLEVISVKSIILLFAVVSVFTYDTELFKLFAAVCEFLWKSSLCNLKFAVCN